MKKTIVPKRKDLLVKHGLEKFQPLTLHIIRAIGTDEVSENHIPGAAVTHRKMYCASLIETGKWFIGCGAIIWKLTDNGLNLLERVKAFDADMIEAARLRGIRKKEIYEEQRRKSV